MGIAKGLGGFLLCVEPCRRLARAVKGTSYLVPPLSWAWQLATHISDLLQRVALRPPELHCSERLACLGVDTCLPGHLRPTCCSGRAQLLVWSSTNSEV